MGVCLTVVCGVPQSSCFGPLSFSLFTNDVQLRSETQSPDSAIVEFVIKIKYSFTKITSTSHCQLEWSCHLHLDVLCLMRWPQASRPADGWGQWRRHPVLRRHRGHKEAGFFLHRQRAAATGLNNSTGTKNQTNGAGQQQTTGDFRSEREPF